MRKRPIILAALLALATTSLFADRLPLTGTSWTSLRAVERGWDPGRLDTVQARLRHQRPTALLVLQDGKVVAEWGETGRKVNVYSIRKSLVSALIGMAVSENRIRLESTLAELGIDDSEPRLTPDEKAATVGDLLTMRSGIYHPASYEIAGIFKARPERGSHPHGSFWFYNNFDSNTLGTIYGHATGEDVFDALERRIARPLGMENFTAHDGEWIRDGTSEHPAYVMRLTARDLARFGQLYLQKGRWEGRQLLPETWIDESVRSYSTSASGLGYGYLWWTLPTLAGQDGAFMALGLGGQVVAVVPSRQLVIVQVLDLPPDGRGIGTTEVVELIRSLIDAAPSGAAWLPGAGGSPGG